MLLRLTTFIRLFSTASRRRIAIVGSGPAGLYAAQRVLKKTNSVQVDVFDKLPFPFGLLRLGVAPDHQSVKQAQNSLSKLSQNPQFRFFGNVAYPSILGFSDLTSLYDAVIFANGSISDRKLGISGEDSIISAREFVGWINGDPYAAQKDWNALFRNVQTVVIIGHGNVALDVARILLKAQTSELATTDISLDALETLKSNPVREIRLIGRRSPAHVAFSAAEIRHILKIGGGGFNFSMDYESLRYNIENNPLVIKQRSVRRVLEVMLATADNKKAQDIGRKTLAFDFLASPIRINCSGPDGKTVESIDMERNEMEGERAKGTGVLYTIPCQMVIRSVGYENISLGPELPWDSVRRVVPNEKGRIVDLNGEVKKGCYVAGWIKRGPSGTIAHTMQDAIETADTVLHDLENLPAPPLADQSIEEILSAKGVNYLTYQDWEKVDEFERNQGILHGKIREKVRSLKDILGIVGKT